IRVSAIAICLAFLILAAGAKSASASCGDWLKHTETDVAILDLNGQTGFGVQLPIEAPKPCEGPNCRGSRPLPAQPIPDSPVSSLKDFGWSMKLVGLPAGDLLGLLCAEFSIGTPSRHNCRIDRPPTV
ncbi:MAG: hypothetical protein ABI557_09720, partial [Aureliella sp.]